MALVDFVETIARGMAKKEYVAAVALDFKKKLLTVSIEKYFLRNLKSMESEE